MNRRKKRQQYLLEVKVHREGQVRRRLKRFGIGLTVITALGLTGYGLYWAGKWTANRFVYQNPRFIISQIVVQNSGVLDPQLVVRFAGVAVGQNLLNVDLDEARRNLELIPLVRRAEVRRVMPSRLVIQLEERVPVARLLIPGHDLFYIDRTGVVMKPIKLTDGTVIQPHGQEPLPVLTGVAAGDAQVGRRVETPQIYQALSLLEQLALSPAGTMLEAERVDLSKAGTLTLVTRQGTAVQFDTDDFSQQLRRLAVILTWARQRQRGVRTVDLTVNRSVPVTFVN